MSMQSSENLADLELLSLVAKMTRPSLEHKRAVLRLEGDISRLYAGSLKTHERAAAAETERDFLKRRNEGLQAFVEKLQMADAAERAALLQCPEAEMRRLSALPQLRPARERA
jgi:hypothetical protein